MNHLNDEQIYKKMSDIINDFDPSISEKKRNCQYYKGHDDDYCKATTHTTCAGCKFFSPTVFTKMRMLVEYIDTLEMRARDNKRKLMAKNKEITLLREEVDLYKHQLSEYERREDGKGTNRKELADDQKSQEHDC